MGTLEIPAEDRIPCLQRLNSYMEQELGFERIKIVGSDLINLVVLFGVDFVLIYSMDDDGAWEKFHFFRNPHIRDLLQRDVLAATHRVISLSPDLWATYQEDLLSAQSLFAH